MQLLIAPKLKQNFCVIFRQFIISSSLRLSPSIYCTKVTKTRGCTLSLDISLSLIFYSEYSLTGETMYSNTKSSRGKSKPFLTSAILQKIKPYSLFLKETLSSPRAVGAVCPSSSYLAQSMAREVDISNDGFVVELGGGTGKNTEALLKHGVSPNKLITIERSAELATYLREKFPDIHVIEGDASQLINLLDSSKGVKKINSIVSGLPFKSLPHNIVLAIKQQIQTLLKNGGKFIQFTYDLGMSSLIVDATFSIESSKIEWRNLPPARVNTMVSSETLPNSQPSLI